MRSQSPCTAGSWKGNLRPQVHTFSAAALTLRSSCCRSRSSCRERSRLPFSGTTPATTVRMHRCHTSLRKWICSSPFSLSLNMSMGRWLVVIAARCTVRACRRLGASAEAVLSAMPVRASSRVRFCHRQTMRCCSDWYITHDQMPVSTLQKHKPVLTPTSPTSCLASLYYTLDTLYIFSSMKNTSRMRLRLRAHLLSRVPTLRIRLADVARRYGNHRSAQPTLIGYSLLRCN